VAEQGDGPFAVVDADLEHRTVGTRQSEGGHETYPGGVAKRPGWLTRLSSSVRDEDLLQLRAHVEISGSAPISACQARTRVTVSGTIRSTRVDMRGGSPQFEAEIFDGHGTVHAMFLGRRRVRGLDVGRRLSMTGMLSKVDGELTVFNPSYELLP
jgi:RecG-like helicase